MKFPLSWQDYQTLEFTSSRHPRHSAPRFKLAQLNDLWQNFLAFFAVSSEPRVWQSQDAAGLLQWKAFDPLSGESVSYDSEAEMRSWLEERHYQYHRYMR